MNKRFFLVLAALLLAAAPFTALRAQVATYTVSEGTGVATDMTGASTFNNSGDDWSSDVIDIGFTFNFAGTEFTQFSVNSNGLVGLGEAQVTWQYDNTLTGSGSYPIIAPFWDDLVAGDGSAMMYNVTGSAPMRVLTIQWRNFHWSMNPDILYTFQVRLYETNKIEFLYIDIPSTQELVGWDGASERGASIGLATSTSDFLSVTPGVGEPATASSTVENNYVNPGANGTPIAANTMYKLYPLVDITTEPSGMTVCAGTDVEFSVAAINAVSYQWRLNGVDLVDGEGVSGSTTATLAISSVAATDAGDYDVVCTGIFDYETSTTATLVVSDPPTLSVTLSPNTLWSPNNQMVDIEATVTVTGDCAPIDVSLVSIESDEGDEVNDVANATFASPADNAFQLRAQRDGMGDGRVYTVTYMILYDIGNGMQETAYATATVVVPHDQRIN